MIWDQHSARLPADWLDHRGPRRPTAEVAGSTRRERIGLHRPGNSGLLMKGFRLRETNVEDMLELQDCIINGPLL